MPRGATRPKRTEPDDDQHEGRDCLAAKQRRRPRLGEASDPVVVWSLTYHLLDWIESEGNDAFNRESVEFAILVDAAGVIVVCLARVDTLEEDVGRQEPAGTDLDAVNRYVNLTIKIATDGVVPGSEVDVIHSIDGVDGDLVNSAGFRFVCSGSRSCFVESVQFEVLELDERIDLDGSHFTSESRIHATIPEAASRMYVQGDICRANLLTEIDGIVSYMPATEAET